MNIEELKKLWHQAFGDTDAFIDTFFAAAFSWDRCRYLSRDGQLAAMLYWFDCLLDGEKIAYIYAVATDVKFRGRGLCHELMADTHGHLASLGYQGTVLVPGSRELFRLYEGMGYRACASIREFVCAPEAEAAPICSIDAPEYARLRRELLPAGGIVQEGENIAFLENFARFYAGPGYLLSASREGDILHGLELLGDVSKAPGILRSLGCGEGRFRTPGQGRPFAMYRPLREGRAPTYFGLAFD